MKNICIKTVLLVLAGVAIAMPFGMLAQDNPIGMIDQLGGNVGKGSFTVGDYAVDAGSLVEIITTLVNWFAWFIALASVIMGLYAGFLFITARGEASQISTARQTLLWAVIGIAVAVLSFSIILLTTTILDL